MRFVDRTRIAPPASLTHPDGAGLRELETAREHYTTPNAAAFSFKAYKSSDVIDALATLFHRKCAYCESSYAAVHPMDVEHYRPKGAVFDDKDHPGYWWLAAEWTNLLPSCIDCNRRRYQDLYRIEAEGGDVTNLRHLAGKQDMFPIAGNRRAGCVADALPDEDALLIDPCQRDPADHLTWATGDPAVPGPALAVPKQVEGGDDRYAHASIDVYGLNRSGLVDARTDILRRLACDLEGLERMVRCATYMPPEALAAELPGIVATAERLAQYGTGPHPYSACTGQFIKSRLKHLLVSLETLKQQCGRAGPVEENDP
ncbi:HNH endonuclease [Oxalobacteraceae sp. CFBP 8761]|nr:HNH endonuclease [Oxalobacteraceae sp. CFBP 8761]